MYAYKLYRHGSLATNPAYSGKAYMYCEERKSFVDNVFNYYQAHSDEIEQDVTAFVSKEYVHMYDRDKYFEQLPEVVRRKLARRKEKTEDIRDSLFEQCFRMSKICFNVRTQEGKAEQYQFIYDNIEARYGRGNGLTAYVEKKIKQAVSNFNNRLKTMERKCELCVFNYTCHLTMDGSIYSDEDEFERAVRRYLSNKADAARGGWGYILVKERGADIYGDTFIIKGRVHFHALLYIPEGEMVGEIIETEKYFCKKRKRRRTRFENTTFRKKFGVNEMEKIEYEKGAKVNPCVSYMQKYMNKDDERASYSRHMPTYDIVELPDDDDNVRIDIRRPDGTLKQFIVSNADIVLPRRFPGKDGQKLKPPKDE
jgi:hypothetical protein